MPPKKDRFFSPLKISGTLLLGLLTLLLTANAVFAQTTPTPTPISSTTQQTTPAPATLLAEFSEENGFGLLLYIIFSLVYIMVIHFAIAINDQFNRFLMTAFFVLGAVVGHFLGSYETGFIIAVILSLVFW